MGSPVLISVVIPTYQRRLDLLRALGALARQRFPAASFEVIVSIDGSSDGTSEAVEHFQAPYELAAVFGSKGGRAAACNAAIELARGDVIVILDDDMEPAPACLENHYRHHPPGSRLCIVGGVPIRVRDTSAPVETYVAAKFNAHLARLEAPGHGFVLRDFYSGNASIRREVLVEVGLFDQGFVLYGNEDLELSMRLRRAGVELRYDGEALASQHYGKRLPELARDTFEKGKTAVLFASAHPDAFDGLQLAQFRARSPSWQAGRAALLALARGWEGTTAGMLLLARVLERAGAWRTQSFYPAVLDYFYWAGVQAALSDPPPQGPLASLANHLHDGPIRLFLHR